MKLIKAFNAKDFKNPKVGVVVKALCELEDDFTKIGQGNVLGGHLLGLSQSFKSDEDAILNMFEKVQVDISLNGLPGKPKPPRQKMKSVEPNNVTDPEIQHDDCIGCTKTDEPDQFESEPAKTRDKVKAGEEKSSWDEAEDMVESGAITIESIRSAKNFREIQNAFLGNADTMKEFCKMEGIKITKGDTTVEKLSKKIYTHYQNEGNN